MTLQPLLTTDEARRITERIRTALDRFSTSWTDLAERVTEAYDRRADLALGYASWSDYATAEFKPAEGLAASVRQQVVGLLSAQGMSTRAIAPVVGVSQMQVVRDVKRDVSPKRIDFATGEVAPNNVVGLDGKSYSRPELKLPKRPPLRDGFRDAALDLDKILGRFDRLVADDRYPRNRDEVAPFRNDLIRARDALDRLIGLMETTLPERLHHDRPDPR